MNTSIAKSIKQGKLEGSEISLIARVLRKATAQVDAVEALVETGWLTTKQFADLIGRSPKTISNKASSGGFEKAKFDGGQWLIHKSELEKYQR